MLRRLLLATAPLCASFALSSPALAAPDPMIVADPSARNLNAYQGVLAWSRQAADGTYRLVLRSNGVVRDAGVPSFDQPVNPDLGPEAGGGIIVVYPRCEGSLRCDLYSYRPASDQERRIGSVSSARYAETAASTYRGRVAFGRSRSAPAGSAQRRRRRATTGVFANRPLRNYSRRVPSETDLDGRRVAFVVRRVGRNLIAMRGLTRRSKTCEIVYDETDGGRGRDLHTNPTFAGGYLYWLHRLVPGDPLEPAGQTFIERVRLPRRGCPSRSDRGDGVIEFARASQPLMAGSIAVDGSLSRDGYFYTDAEGIKQATGDEISFSKHIPF